MTSGYLITLDCIIFGLQRFGGISNYWAKLVEHVSVDPALAGSLVLPKHLTYRDFDTAWLQRMPVLGEKLDARIGRYLPARTAGDGGVLHTSYYRLPRHRVGKYVVSVYDFTYERYRTGLARFVHTKQKLASIRRADAVLCISESTRQDVIEFCPGVDTSKLHVIHLGVDVETFYQESTSSPNTNEQTVLFVGQRGGYKRFDLAVEAVRQSPRLSLGIVGPTLTDDERTLLVMRLGNRWQEFGPVSTTDLRRLYSSAFAFIFPSDYEGFGLPILEAMACGCPVVSAALSSLPEVGGTAALYADSQTGESYATALSTFISGAVREDAVRRGIERVAQFDWFQTVQKTKAVYLDR
ncbi:glycosyltransferase family 1 protein [Limnohabitans sp. 2KL-27]|uniref:glycosyltransferase family 4 protein n=1 Tax=Limnohabitans sp. 2KL-27 TaxID=1100705 RepID=UPI000A6524CE|nr:glycosyltransferase family 1 protein [Limnohabitans sp. 2KL-27]